MEHLWTLAYVEDGVYANEDSLDSFQPNPFLLNQKGTQRDQKTQKLWSENILKLKENWFWIFYSFVDEDKGRVSHRVWKDGHGLIMIIIDQ